MACAAPAVLAGQGVTVTGRVLLGGADSLPVRGTWAVLHHVTRDGGGPVDSTRTDAAGRYRIRLRAVDTTAVYVVSAWHDSLAYFSAPVNVEGRTVADAGDLVVYRATEGAPPVAVARRLVTIARPAPDGSRDVLEILELENGGLTTRISIDTLVPTWAGSVPRGALRFQAGQGDISPDAVGFRGDSVLVLGPIPPGLAKQLSYGYQLPADLTTFTIPIDQATQELNLLLEDTTAIVAAPGVEPLGVNELEQRRFAAYRAGPLAAGDSVTIALPRGPVRPQMLLPFVIGALALAMGAALVWALRKKPRALAPPLPPS